MPGSASRAGRAAKSAPPPLLARVDDRPAAAVEHLYGVKGAEYLRLAALTWCPEALAAVFSRDPALTGGLRALDAGCGAGTSTFALLDALARRQLAPGVVHGFDVMKGLLDRFAAGLSGQGPANLEFRRADALAVWHDLPAMWRDYDLALSSGLLEHIPGRRLVEALAALRGRLAPGGRLLVFPSRRKAITGLLTEPRWRATCHGRQAVVDALLVAGFVPVKLCPFPHSHGWMNLRAVAVEASPLERRRPAAVART